MYTIRVKTMCSPDKIGGWSAIVNKKVISGGACNTTVNRMELTALIEAIKTITPHGTNNIVQLVGTSKWLRNAMSSFRAYQEYTRRRGVTGKLLTLGGHELANQDLWNELIILAKAKNIKIMY